MKIYIAGPFFNDDQLFVIETIEGILDANNVGYYSPRKDGVLKNMTKEERFKEMKKIYEKNILMIRDCSGMIAVIEGESGKRDTGTVFEVGYAVSLRNHANMEKSIITFSRESGANSVMLSESADVHINGFSNLEKCVKDIFNFGMQVAIDGFIKVLPEDVE
jgi:nucleoside 2-deoxyribosyltransferase